MVCLVDLHVSLNGHFSKGLRRFSQPRLIGESVVIIRSICSNKDSDIDLVTPTRFLVDNDASITYWYGFEIGD